MCYNTLPGTSISASPNWCPASNSILSACSSTRAPNATYTVAPLPKVQVKIQNTLHHWRSCLLITCRDLHRLLGYADLCGHACSKRSAAPPPHLVVGVRGLAPEMGPCQTGFQWPRPFSISCMVGLPCGLTGGLTECPRDRDHSVHRCLQPWMGCTARLPYAARNMISSAGKPAHQSVWDGGSASWCN